MRDVAVEAYKEASPTLVASLVGGLVTGAVPGGTRVELRTVPGLLVLVPALLATRGDIYGSLGARIVTALHQGLIEPRVTGGDERLRAAATTALANGVLTNAFATAVAYFLLTFFGSRVVPLPTFVGVAIVADLLPGIIPTVVVISVVFTGYRRGRNPNTIIGPVVMTTGDVFGALFLLIAVRTVPVVAGVSRVPTEWTVRAITWAMLPMLLVLMLVELGSGLVLGSLEAQLFRYPSLFVLAPVTIGVVGNLGSVLAVRPSTPFRLRTSSFSPYDDELMSNAVAAPVLMVTVLPVIGAGVWVATLLVSDDTSLVPQKVVLVALSGGVSPAVLVVIVTFSMMYLAYRFGPDPNDVVIPVVTNLCDALGAVVLFGVA